MFHSNQHTKNYLGRLNRFAKKLVKRSAIACIIVWALVGALKIGQHYFPKTVYAEKEVPIKGHAPVMDRIAKCESNNSHINPKTGQVYMLANTNKTVDVGKYMINTVWHKKAKELGLDITIEKDNEKMAYFIFENYGTQAWTYSSNCWN